MVFWEGYVSDEVMGTFAPIVVYWLYAGFYQLLPPLDNYRLHTRKEEDEKNLVPLPSVIKGVLLQQLAQATVAHLLFLVIPSAVLFESLVLKSSVDFGIELVIGKLIDLGAMGKSLLEYAAKSRL